MKLSTLDLVALILVIIGGLNWGFVAFNFNLVTAIFGSMPWLVTTVYFLVGLSAVYSAAILFKLEKR